MAPKGWWGNDTTRKGTPVIVTMENVNYSVVEIDSAFRPIHKDRVKNAKQFTWVLILKANRAVGCLAWIGHILWSLLGGIKKRLFFRRGVSMETNGKGKLLFSVIMGLLIIALAFLAFEVIAHYMRWPYYYYYYFQQQHVNLHIPQTLEIRGWFHLIYVFWLDFRADYIAPLILAFSKFCVVLFLIQSLDRMILCLGCFWIKYKNIKPTINGGDPFIEGSTTTYTYPMVLVQIPMCNEKEVKLYYYIPFVYLILTLSLFKV